MDNLEILRGKFFQFPRMQEMRRYSYGERGAATNFQFPRMREMRLLLFVARMVERVTFNSLVCGRFH